MKLIDQTVGWDKIIRPKKEGGLGIRAARESNIALLGKLVWDMQQNPNKLWVSMLRQKYVKQVEFLTCPNKYGSPTWNVIMKARDVLKEGYQFRISKGQSLFWYSPWTSFGPLCDLVFAMDIQDTALTIKDLYNHNHWDWQLQRTDIPSFVKDYINAIIPFFHDNVTDGFT